MFRIYSQTAPPTVRIPINAVEIDREFRGREDGRTTITALAENSPSTIRSAHASLLPDRGREEGEAYSSLACRRC